MLFPTPHSHPHPCAPPTLSRRSLTMVMKTAYIGPDTAYEKFLACMMVIFGSLVYIVVLASVVSMLTAYSKSTAIHRDERTTVRDQHVEAQPAPALSHALSCKACCDAPVALHPRPSRVSPRRSSPPLTDPCALPPFTGGAVLPLATHT